MMRTSKPSCSKCRSVVNTCVIFRFRINIMEKVMIMIGSKVSWQLMQIGLG